MLKDFTERVLKIIKKIPEGKVLTYGTVAALAGNNRAARQVSWILHSSGEKHQLPWHRVINAQGKISLGNPEDYERQKALLQSEGVRFSKGESIDLDEYLWIITSEAELAD